MVGKSSTGLRVRIKAGYVIYVRWQIIPSDPISVPLIALLFLAELWHCLPVSPLEVCQSFREVLLTLRSTGVGPLLWPQCWVSA